MENKTLPGAYMNFVAAARPAQLLSERGVAALPFAADWGPEDQVRKVEREEFQEDSLKLFGYESAHSQMQPLREIFRNATVLYCYRLNTGTKQAANPFATARYGGTRGNALRIVIRKNVDEESRFDVQTWIDGIPVDSQTVGTASELTDSEFVIWKKDAELAETAGTPLTGGEDGTARSGEAYQRFLSRMEAYSFHALGCNTDEKEIVDLFVAFTKRMRDEAGVKFQTVVYRAEQADYEGVISVENRAIGVDPAHSGEFALVYWMTGAAAACAVNQSNTNKVYDGEYTVDTAYTQRELANGLSEGKLLFHQVGDDIRILSDVNTLVTETEEKSGDFKSNQTIRVLDQIGNDIAALFARQYLGKIPNDASGRISLWNSVVTYFKQLEAIRAIENFASEEVICDLGNDKKSIRISSRITPVNAMEKLYMTVVVS